MNRYIVSSFLFILILVVACNPKHEEAQAHLDAARKLYIQGRYDDAKAEIDSINTLHPKALNHRRQGLALLDTVRRADDMRTVQICDSMIEVNKPIIESMKKLFVFQKDKEYQTSGFYIPKETVSNGQVAYTILRSGVGEDGTMYLESVFVGAQRHDRMRVSVAGGETIESSVVTDDGLNYSFTTLDKRFEIIRFTGNDINIARIIADNGSKNISIMLDGKAKNTYSLSPTLKNAVGKSYRLSQAMLLTDSLTNKKEECELRIRYIDNREEINKIDNELKSSGKKLRNVD